MTIYMEDSKIEYYNNIFMHFKKDSNDILKEIKEERKKIEKDINNYDIIFKFKNYVKDRLRQLKLEYKKFIDDINNLSIRKNELNKLSHTITDYIREKFNEIKKESMFETSIENETKEVIIKYYKEQLKKLDTKYNIILEEIKEEKKEILLQKSYNYDIILEFKNNVNKKMKELKSEYRELIELIKYYLEFEKIKKNFGDIMTFIRKKTNEIIKESKFDISIERELKKREKENIESKRARKCSQFESYSRMRHIFYRYCHPSNFKSNAMYNNDNDIFVIISLQKLFDCLLAINEYLNDTSIKLGYGAINPFNYFFNNLKDLNLENYRIKIIKRKLFFLNEGDKNTVTNSNFSCDINLKIDDYLKEKAFSNLSCYRGLLHHIPINYNSIGISGDNNFNTYHQNFCKNDSDRLFITSIISNNIWHDYQPSEEDNIIRNFIKDIFSDNKEKADNYYKILQKFGMKINNISKLKIIEYTTEEYKPYTITKKSLGSEDINVSEEIFKYKINNEKTINYNEIGNEIKITKLGNLGENQNDHEINIYGTNTYVNGYEIKVVSNSESNVKNYSICKLKSELIFKIVSIFNFMDIDRLFDTIYNIQEQN